MSETVRVRIPVLVAGDGRWHAEGWAGMGDAESSGATGIMLDALEPSGPWVIHWIEADVPLPATGQTIVGEHAPTQEPKS